jgi:hypothetical protein
MVIPFLRAGRLPISESFSDISPPAWRQDPGTVLG